MLCAFGVADSTIGLEIESQDCNLSLLGPLPLTRCHIRTDQSKSRTFINGRDKESDISDFHMDHDSNL